MVTINYEQISFLLKSLVDFLFLLLIFDYLVNVQKESLQI
jgi:hypothetical protein